jgi:DNA replication protein DnaC
MLKLRQVLRYFTEGTSKKQISNITSQLPIKGWYEVIGEQTIADAILDRVVHNAHRIELKGESLRKKQITKEEEKE